MRNYLIFNGVNYSTQFNCFIARSNMFDSASEDVTVVSIPGRNGDYHISNNRYNTFKAEVTVYIPNDMQNYIDNMRATLMSTKTLCRYEEALRPNEFRLARFMDAFEVEASDRQGMYMKLVFECRPERFLKSGETVVSKTASGYIDNSTLFNAKPLIRIYGKGTLTIGSYTVKVNSVSSYVDIDFDSLQAYKGTTNCNGNVEFGELVLVPGRNTITLGSGITKIEVTPRWYTL